MTSDPHNKKFLFDLNNFDELSEEEERKKNPPAPTFSLADMEEARASAFEKGKSEGLQMAKDSIEQRMEIIVQSLAQNFATLENEESIRSDKLEKACFVIIYKALKSVFPALFVAVSKTEIENFITKFFDETATKSQYKLIVHSDLVDTITPIAKKIHPEIIVKGDDKTPLSSAHIEWTQGKATWNPQKTADDIMAIIARYVDNPAELLDESAKTTHNEDSNSDNDVTPTDTEES